MLCSNSSRNLRIALHANTRASERLSRRGRNATVISVLAYKFCGEFLLENVCCKNLTEKRGFSSRVYFREWFQRLKSNQVFNNASSG